MDEIHADKKRLLQYVTAKNTLLHPMKETLKDRVTRRCRLGFSLITVVALLSHYKYRLCLRLVKVQYSKQEIANSFSLVNHDYSNCITKSPLIVVFSKQKSTLLLIFKNHITFDVIKDVFIVHRGVR